MIFSAKDHSYIKDDKKYTSVSTLIGKYKKPYNGEYWSTYKAYEAVLGKDAFKKLRKDGGFKLEDPAFFDYLKPLTDSLLVEQAKLDILKQWEHEKDKSIVKGNNYHSFKEKQSIELGYCTNPYLNKDFKTIESTLVEKKGSNEIRKPIVTNLYDLEDGFHPEAIVWNDDVMLSGQIDKLYIETIKDKRFIDIDDYKTNKKIATTNFFGKMLPPLDHLDCCNYHHYRLQISTYAWLLEQAGFIPRYIGFTHINTPYRFDYNPKEVELMLTHAGLLETKYDF
jgi:ATP-dependent exoDNAse (exonuclease V) beta subunit